MSRAIILQPLNPEQIIAKALREFLVDATFSELYPNFGNVRVTSIHPFALLLFQDVAGQELDFSVFPAICVADTSDNESEQLLDKGGEPFVLTPEIWTDLKLEFPKETLLLSASKIAAIDALPLSTLKYTALRHTLISSHQIDINIWTENKDLTSVVYDAVRAFALNETKKLHYNGVDVVGGISGRRSGDINVEFGRLLYGANLTLPCRVTLGAVEVPLAQNSITSVDLGNVQFHP